MNIDSPQGLKWIGNISSALLSGVANRYNIPATDTANYFIGQPVVTTGESTAQGVPIAAALGAGEALRGVIVGFEFNPDNLNSIYGVGSTDRSAIVVDSPFALFVIQTDGTLVTGDISGNADMINFAAGDTVTAMSSAEIDQTTMSPTDGQLRIIRLHDVVDNEMGEFADVIVMINEHELKQIAGT